MTRAAEARYRGRQGERLAAGHLRAAGLLELGTNYCCRYGEIDLIMEDAGTLVFVEVKTRGSSAYGGAVASVSQRKQQRLVRTAQCYLQQQYGDRQSHPPPCRFDVVTVDCSRQPPSLNWLRGAFTS